MRLPGSKSISNRTLLLAALARGDTDARRPARFRRHPRDARGAQGARRVASNRLGSPQRVRVHGIGPARGFPVKRAELFMGNCGHVGAFAHGRAGALRRPLPARRRAAHARAPHRRPGGRACAPWVRASSTRARRDSRRSRFRRATASSMGTIHVRGEVSSQFLSARAHGAAVDRRERAHRDRRRAHLQALRGTHAGPDGALRRARDARGLARLHRPGRGLRVARHRGRRGRCLVGFVLPRGRRHRRRARCASKASGVPAPRATYASPTCSRPWARRVEMGDDWIECAGKPPLKPFDLDMNRIPDAAMTAAVLALFAEGGTSTLRNIAQLAREGDRSHRRHGDRAAQVRRDGGGGRGFPRGDAARGLPRAPRRRRRRQSTPTTTTAWRCASRSRPSARVPVRINDPDCVAKTFPDYFAAFARLVSVNQ